MKPEPQVTNTDTPEEPAHAERNGMEEPAVGPPALAGDTDDAGRIEGGIAALKAVVDAADQWLNPPDEAAIRARSARLRVLADELEELSQRLRCVAAAVQDEGPGLFDDWDQ